LVFAAFATQNLLAAFATQNLHVPQRSSAICPSLFELRSPRYARTLAVSNPVQQLAQA
jgi:hypothetical protein